MLRSFTDAQATSRKNLGQGKWLELSDSIDSRIDTLSKLDRIEINEAFKTIYEKGAEHYARSSIVAELQHDFIAGIARDYFTMRRPRLARLYGRITSESGYAGDDGVIKDVILKYIENLVKAGTINDQQQ